MDFLVAKAEQVLTELSELYEFNRRLQEWKSRF